MQAVSHHNRTAVGILILVTLAYLIVELAFSASLLDAVSSAVKIHDLDKIEMAGRLISGFAVTLALTSFVVGRLVTGGAKTWAVFLMAFLAVMVATQHFEDNLVTSSTNSATNEARVDAVYLGAVREGVIDGTMGLAGMNVDLTTPAGKAFVTLFPALASASAPQLRSTLKPILQANIKNHLDDQFSDFYTTVYAPSAQRVLTAYRSFVASHLGPISPAQFINSAQVQKQWAEALHYTGHERLTVDADQAYVERAIKPGFMRYEYEHATAGLGGDSLTARSAYQLMIAPILALLFSILGAMLHTVKIINYSLVLVSIRGAIRATLVMMLCVGFTGFVWMTANPVTDAPLFKQLEKTQGAISPAAMRWIIQAEAVVYPISSSILSTVQPAVAKPVEAKPTRFIQL